MTKLVARNLLSVACIIAVSAPACFASEAMWQSYMKSAEQADAAGNYAEASKLLAAALKEAEGFGETDARFMKTIRGLAEAYEWSGKFGLSETVYKRILDIYEKNPKKNQINIAWSLKGLASCFSAQARYSEAEALQKRYLEIVIEQTGAKSRNAAVALDGLGRIYAEQGRFTAALPLHEQALQILADLAKTEKDPKRVELLLDNISTALRNGADAESYLGKFDEAIESLKQLIAIQEKLSAKPNPLIASAYGSMATAYRRKGDYDEADKNYKTALAMYEQVLGPNHRDTAVVLNAMATNYMFQGKTDDAERYYKQALAIFERMGGEQPDVWVIYRNLGTFYFQQKNYSEAKACYLRGLDIREKALGPNSESVLSIVENLGRLYKAMGDFTEAKVLFQRLLRADESAYGAESPVVASDLKELAEINAALKQDDESRGLMRRADQITHNLPGSSRLGALAEMSGTAPGAASGSSPPVRDKWALVVGISKFKDPSINLKYAAKDAVDFRNYLVSSAHFKPDHVKLLIDENATRDTIVAELGGKWLGRLANKDDLVVVYLSSHGSTTKAQVGVNFLVAADTNPNALLGTGIPMQWLSEIIKEQVHCDRVVLVIDVCHSGAATSGAAGATASSGEKRLIRQNNFDIENLKLGSGQAVICSSLSDQVSWESKQYENSVFTRKLIEALKKRGDQTTLTEAYQDLRREVESEVLRDRGELQTPVLNMKSWTGPDPVLSATPASPRPGL